MNVHAFLRFFFVKADSDKGKICNFVPKSRVENVCAIRKSRVENVHRVQKSRHENV